MGIAKRRKELLQNLTCGPIPESGIFLSSTQHGVTVIVAARADQSQATHAGLFCMDDWQEGLVHCLGRTYDSETGFQEQVKESNGAFRPMDGESCRQRIGRALYIRRLAKAPVPIEFDRWRSLLGSLDESASYPSLYDCPKCGADLPREDQQKILTSIGRANCYCICTRCVESDDHPPLDSLLFPHQRRKDMFAGLTTFSLNPPPNASRLLMAIPDDTHLQAIRLALSEEPDPVFAATLALETWIVRAARPNDPIEDLHVELALEQVLQNRARGIPLPDTTIKEVIWIRDAVLEAAEAFGKEASGLLSRSQCKAIMNAGVEKVLASVRRHRTGAHSRAYINFAARFVR